MRVLAPLFVLTYVAVAASCALLSEGRGWTMTAVSAGGLLINPLLNLALIPPCARGLRREGSGGVGCALAMLATESAVTSTMLFILGRRAFDLRLLSAVGKMLVACAAAVALHALLRSPRWRS